MLNRALEVGGQAMEVGGQHFLQPHNAPSETKDAKENGDATTEEGESTDSEQTSQGSDRRADQKAQPILPPSAAQHEMETLPQNHSLQAPLPHSAQKEPGVDEAGGVNEDDDITAHQKQSCDRYEDYEVFTTWVRESMPVAASCQGPSESKEPVYIEALHDEMPRGLRKERNLKKFLKEEPKGPALFGKVTAPAGRNVSGMSCPEMSQEDQDALKKMLQMWAPGPNQDDDGADLTPGIGSGAKTHKKSWAARCVPCRGKVPADSTAQKPLRNKSAEEKTHRKGIFRFFSTQRGKT